MANRWGNSGNSGWLYFGEDSKITEDGDCSHEIKRRLLLGRKVMINLLQFTSVAQSCLTLCDPMNRSMPGLSIHHQHPDLSKPMSIESVMPSNCLILCCQSFFSCLQSSPASESFQMNQLFASGGQSIGVSASTSVLPMNTQDWSPLGWTGWVSLQSKGLSRVFSNTTVQKHQFFGAQLSL